MLQSKFNKHFLIFSLIAFVGKIKLVCLFPVLHPILHGPLAYILIVIDSLSKK